MKYSIIFGFIAAFLTACSPAENSDGSDQELASKSSETLTKTAPGRDKGEDRQAWLISDDRPVNRACNEENYRFGQLETYPGLDAPHYPIIQALNKKLVKESQALAPKVTDEGVYDLEADTLVRRQIAILNQLVFMSGQDLAPRYLLGVCDIQSYEQDNCAIVRRMYKGTLQLDNFSREDSALSYTAQYSDSTRAKIYIANRDLDGLRLETFSPAQGRYRGEWLRADDGTETFSAISAEGTFSYTENPDCSGDARAVRKDDSGHDWRLSWQWTPVKNERQFTVQYSECKTNGLDDEKCISGTMSVTK